MNRNSERARVDETVAATYRAAYLRSEQLSKAAFDAQRACNAAEQAFREQAEAVARYTVRSAHPDWFHPNGDQRGIYREAIKQARIAVVYALWTQYMPETTAMRAERPYEAEVWRTEVENYSALVEQHREKKWQERLARESDPTVVARVVEAKAALDALPRGTDEWRAAWEPFAQAMSKLTDRVTCEQCGAIERVLQNTLNYNAFAITDNGLEQESPPYTCAACKRAKRRKAQLAGRRERQAAQRRAQIRKLRG